ncbi:MAG: UMP kinase [Candidatus Bipolaricaulota bacterium]
MHPPSCVLLKLSGEAFKGPQGPLSPESLRHIVEEIASLNDTRLAIVVGGGNIIRGARNQWLGRVEADALGMLATIINGLALKSFLEEFGREVIVQSAIVSEFAEPVAPDKACAAMRDGKIVVFVGGTGNPFVTTDTAAAVRAAAIRADVVAKASNVDGVFTSDPAKGGATQLLRELSFDAFIEKRYGVMDLVAVEICRENNLPIVVFNWNKPGALRAIASGEKIGTLIC